MENIHNHKKFWQITNEILFNKNSSKNEQSKTLNVNNVIIDNQKKIPDLFNDFFINIGNTNPITSTDYLQHNNHTSNLYLSKTTPN